MSQYQIGTVSVTNGSPTVTGVDTEFSTYASIGDLFKISDVSAHYTIGVVNSDTELTLTANWAGSNLSDKTYQIVRDFTPNYNIPEIWIGDKDWPYHLTQGLRIIDQYLLTGKKTVVPQGEVTTDRKSTRLNSSH